MTYAQVLYYILIIAAGVLIGSLLQEPCHGARQYIKQLRKRRKERIYKRIIESGELIRMRQKYLDKLKDVKKNQRSASGKKSA